MENKKTTDTKDIADTRILKRKSNKNINYSLIQNKTTKEFYFKNSYAGLKLFSKLSKSQKRKWNRYGTIPTQPTKDLTKWFYTDKHIKIAKDYNLGRGVCRQAKPKYYIKIANELKRINKLSFLDDAISPTIKQDIGSLFLMSLSQNFHNPLITKGDRKIKYEVNKQNGNQTKKH